MTKKVLVIIIVLFQFHSAFTMVRNVPGTYSTIQSALNACLPGDTVLVQPGSYFENISWPAITGITLLSSGGPSVTNINGGGMGRVLSITSSVVDTTTVISGFTISGGYDSNGIPGGLTSGAGIFVTNASVIMEDLIIIDNHLFSPTGFVFGAGIYLNNSSSRIRNCKIDSNTIDSAQFGGGAGVFVGTGVTKFQNVEINNNNINASQFTFGVGILIQSSSLGIPIVFLEQVKITNNYSGDNAIYYYGNGLYSKSGHIYMTNVLIASNRSGAGNFHFRGGGMHLTDWTEVEMIHVTVTDNSRSGGGPIIGSGIYIDGYSAWIKNCILFNPNSGNEIEVLGTYAGVAAFYSNIRGGFFGSNIIDTVPGFVSQNDFHLTPVSPCAGIGSSNGAPLTDLDGNPRPMPVATMPDMGCYEVDQNPTGVAQFQYQEGELIIYPNPIILGMDVTIEKADSPVVIYDATGRIVKLIEREDAKIKLNTASFNSGWYLIKAGNRKPQKLIVQ